MPSAAAGLMILALLTAPNTDLADCANLALRHQAAVAKVIAALRKYEACLATGDRHNDCNAQIEALDAAHDDFADIVADAEGCR